MKLNRSILLLLTGSAMTAYAADNWPQWRGPLQTGAAPGANPPVRWSETENVKWKVRIAGDGTATPVIWEKMIFVQTAIPTGKKTEAATAAGDSSADQPRVPRPGPAGGVRSFGPAMMLSR